MGTNEETVNHGDKPDVLKRLYGPPEGGATNVAMPLGIPPPLAGTPHYHLWATFIIRRYLLRFRVHVSVIHLEAEKPSCHLALFWGQSANPRKRLLDLVISLKEYPW